VRIVDETTGQQICPEAHMRDTAEGRRKGLMDSPEADIVLDIGHDSRLMSMIHMFNMRYGIGVIWVDSSMKAVDVRRHVPPSRLAHPGSWKMHMPKKPARYVIELGATKDWTCEEGDTVVFEGRDG